MALKKKPQSIETVDIENEVAARALAVENARIAAAGGMETVDPDTEHDGIRVRVEIEGEGQGDTVPVTDGDYVTVFKHLKTGNFSQFNQNLVGNSQFKVMRVHKDNLARLELR